MKQKSNRVIVACRLDKRDREKLEARAETLTTTVGELVERYVLAGLRVDRSVVSGSATPHKSGLESEMVFSGGRSAFLLRPQFRDVPSDSQSTSMRKK